jgi:hypothetical protein
MYVMIFPYGSTSKIGFLQHRISANRRWPSVLSPSDWNTIRHVLCRCYICPALTAGSKFLTLRCRKFGHSPLPLSFLCSLGPEVITYTKYRNKPHQKRHKTYSQNNFDQRPSSCPVGHCFKNAKLHTSFVGWNQLLTAWSSKFWVSIVTGS